MNEKLENIIKDKQYDLISQSRDSMISSFNVLFHEHKEDVKKTIQTTVNGKIDDIKKHLERQDLILKELSDKIQPYEDAKTWFNQFKSGVVWVAGVVTPLSIIAAIFKFTFKFFVD